MFRSIHQLLKLVHIKTIVVAMLLITFVAPVKAMVPSYVLEQDKHLVVDYLHLLLEEPQQKTVDQLSDLTNQAWHKIHLTNGDLLIMPGTNWFAFELINTTKKAQQVYLDIANQVRMSHVELFAQNNDKNSPQNTAQIKMQLQRSNNYSGKISIPSYSKITLYLTIKSATQLRSSVNVYSTKGYIDASNALQFQQGIEIGGLLCLSIAFMLLFIATGNKPTFILSGYFLSNSLILSSMLGVNLYYILPDSPELIGVELPLLISASAIFLLIYTIQLFNLKVRLNRVYQAIRVCVYGLFLYMPLSIVLSVVDNIAICMVIFALVNFLLVILGLYLHKLGSRLALFFTFAMAIQFIFVGVVIISVNWLDIGFIAYRSLFYGVLFWLNSLLVTFILSRQYRYQLKDKQEAQRQALTSAIASEQAQEELLKLQSKSQEDLENRVQERTLELNIALQELEEANHELEQKNTLDELTGLFNRRFYDQKIIAEYRRSKRNLTPLSLVIIDIDHFKKVNDTYGHLAGDFCLTWLSEQIQQSLKRSTDMPFRYGGEEFCLILPDTDAKGALALAESLRLNIAKKACVYNDKRIMLTISNGIFTYQQQENITPEKMFSGADKALYQAKNNGRNQTHVCSDVTE